MAKQTVCKRCHKVVQKSGAFTIFVNTIDAKFAGVQKELSKIQKLESSFKQNLASNPDYLLDYIGEASEIMRDFMLKTKAMNNYAATQFYQISQTMIMAWIPKESLTTQIINAGKKIFARIAQVFKPIS